MHKNERGHLTANKVTAFVLFNKYKFNFFVKAPLLNRQKFGKQLERLSLVSICSMCAVDFFFKPTLNSKVKGENFRSPQLHKLENIEILRHFGVGPWE